MLFGLGEEAVDPGLAAEEIRLCALNVQSPTALRASELARWLIGTGANLLVLTELRSDGGGPHLVAELEASGYDVTLASGWQRSKYFTAVASRGFDIEPVSPAWPEPRVVTVDLRAAAHTFRVCGVYAPTNGMTAESSRGRQDFQTRLITYVRGLADAWPMLLTGDLNVLERGHRPPNELFLEHDYVFHDELAGLLIDGYRHLCGDVDAHSWISDRYGAQRLDHLFVSADSARRLTSVSYDHVTRKLMLSDHAALRACLDLRTS
jgi:exodeoxyribonuclease-3